MPFSNFPFVEARHLLQRQDTLSRSAAPRRAHHVVVRRASRGAYRQANAAQIAIPCAAPTAAAVFLYGKHSIGACFLLEREPPVDPFLDAAAQPVDDARGC